MMRKFNITFFYTNFLYAEKFVDLTLQACRWYPSGQSTAMCYQDYLLIPGTTQQCNSVNSFLSILYRMCKQ